MNDPKLALNKLGELGLAALEASNEADKAAVFAAVHILVSKLDDQIPDHMGENLERIRWSISAILGYDVDNGHSRDQHLTWAFAAIEELKRVSTEIMR